MSESIKLTAYSKGAGCGCKISPQTLSEILATNDDLPPDNRVLIGNETNDDAAVMIWDGDECLISTTDFFMPIVDDAETFGRIAAANALSDVYAMGGEPVLAIGILGWPVDKLSADVARKVLDGARFMCRMAGITLAGGHSIDSPEPFFGLSVNGRVHRSHIKANNTAKEGDVIFLTKPIGTGIITTAAKRGLVRNEDIDAAISYMCSLNKVGTALGKISGVHAMTDVTGFGLLGHLIEVCEGSNVSATIKWDAVPKFPGVKFYLDQFIYPDMTTRNFSTFSAKTSSLSAEQLFLMCDPQTSGGLLVTVGEESATEVSELLKLFGLPAEVIGHLHEKADKCVTIS